MKLLCSLGDISSPLYVNPSPVISVKENLSSSVFLGQYANLSIISPTYHMLYTSKCISELATAVVKTYAFSQERKAFFSKYSLFSSVGAFDLFYFALKFFHC